MIESIFVRISYKERLVEVTDSWGKLSSKKGIKRKFKANQSSYVLKFILQETKDIPAIDFQKWNVPKWIKDYHYRVNAKHKVYASTEGKDIVIQFEDSFPIIIEKNDMFYNCYDKHVYIFDKILSIGKMLEMTKIEIVTDLVELLKLNRIFWNTLPIETYVSISDVNVLVKQYRRIKGE